MPKAGSEAWLPAFVKIAAIGTLADVVPLVGENRVIAKLGLELLSRGPHKVGLRALLDIAGLTGKTIDSYHIAFMVAPRVNAAGRMATPDIATRLLLASDEALAVEAQALAQQLDTENTRRREEEQDIGPRRPRRSSTPIRRSARTACWSWPARAGIAASSASSPSKLVDTFYRPAIVLSIEDGLAHGSCRSVPGFDMLAALESCAPMLTRFGGHQPGGRPAVGRRPHQAVPRGDQRPRPRSPRSRRPAAAPPPRRPARFRRRHPDIVEQLATLAPYGHGQPEADVQRHAVESSTARAA